MNKKVIGYMCEIDFDWELGEAPRGSRVYRSIEDLKGAHTCWAECGIVEVEVTKVNVVCKSNRFGED